MRTVVIDDAFIKRQEAIAHRLVNGLYRQFDKGELTLEEVEAQIPRVDRQAYALALDEKLKRTES